MPGDVCSGIADIPRYGRWSMSPNTKIFADVAGGQGRDGPRTRLPDRIFTGKGRAGAHPQINKETRTARVRIDFPNPDGCSCPTCMPTPKFATGTETPVPDGAQQRRHRQRDAPVVLLDKGEGRFEPRAVKLGRRGDGRVEIMEGLAEGDKVVVSANFLIDAESNLKAALNGLDTGEKSQ